MTQKHKTSQAVDNRVKDFLTEAEIKRFLDAARRGRHGVRDYLMMLMAYRHGLRVSELIDLRIDDLDLDSAACSSAAERAACPPTSPSRATSCGRCVPGYASGSSGPTPPPPTCS